MKNTDYGKINGSFFALLFTCTFALVCCAETMPPDRCDSSLVAVDCIPGTGNQNTRIFLIDPDEFSRNEILKFRESGAIVAAWLNLGRIEPSRTFSVASNEKLKVKYYGYREGNPVAVRFYSSEWHECLEHRLTELFHKGCNGLLFTGTDAHKEVSDHPMMRSEMLKLITRCSERFKKLVSDAYIILHNDCDPAFDLSLAGIPDCMAIESIWLDNNGRQKPKWLVDRRLAQLKKLQSKGMKVIAFENAKSKKIFENLAAKAREIGIIAVRTSLPLLRKDHVR